MIKTELPIYLASRSPRRRKLIKQLGINVKSFSVDMDEYFKSNENPVKLVKRLANEKLNLAIIKISRGIIITADTIVVLDNEIIGKPENKADAIRMLKKLSGRDHNVYTGFSLLNTVTKKRITDYEKTKVRFRKLVSTEIEKYVQTGSSMDKAGAYGIQDDIGAVFIEKINGCYYNVVGLPLTKLYISLKKIC